MKKNVFFLVIILVLPLFLQSPAHAALTPYSNASKTNIVNYADLFYPNFYHGMVTVGNRVGSSVSSENNHSYSDNFEAATFGGNSYPSGHSGVTFSGSATASSGISDGVLYSSAYAGMTYEGFTGSSTDTPGVEAEQQITAQFTQYYTDPVGSTMQITGSLDLGEIFFDLLDTDVFSDYSIRASVTVNEGTFSQSGSTVANVNLASLELSSDNLSESAIISTQPGSFGKEGDYYYSVTTSLTIAAILDNTWIENGAVIADAFSGNEFLLGDSENPIMVTASWSDASTTHTPVPSSLLLMISGVAGISFIRRRRAFN
ncbi:VPLPA-CTERM sorting domain-containing protein [Desulfobacter latus]|uniref:PEP-CTERM sorting domain-containing protein n=1 Tax=Desulfobacter latus TaxID=2292 RepID=A0A850T4S9_9BACT|nr:VPLPA-CTERM sorting domain-containing protein [Desulfobacter latus]NWH04282.1 PEP-CTERM sorting domain-containing protein [Desulfobacter latus]